jgi:chemotaxis protein CheC
MPLRSLSSTALTSLLDLGFGRAAHGLAELTPHPVQLDVSRVAIQSVDNVCDSLGPISEIAVASVHQRFSGPIAGDALLILGQSRAAILKELLTDEPALPLSIDASAREILTEIGNIVLNACLGTFTGLLQLPVRSSVPQISLVTVDRILDSLRVSGEEAHYAIVVHAAFKLRDAEVPGFLVIVLSVASLDRVLRAVEDWEQRNR